MVLHELKGPVILNFLRLEMGMLLGRRVVSIVTNGFLRLIKCDVVSSKPNSSRVYPQNFLKAQLFDG